MAMINCYECGKEISTSATSCPKCGAQRNTNMFNSTCPWCGRPAIMQKAVNTPNGMKMQCGCGGIFDPPQSPIVNEIAGIMKQGYDERRRLFNSLNKYTCCSNVTLSNYGFFKCGKYDESIYENDITGICQFYNRDHKCPIEIKKEEKRREEEAKIAKEMAKKAADKKQFETDIKIGNNGDVNVWYRLGESYYFGNGVTQNYTEAVNWYRKAAEQGFALAQFCMGRAYRNGYGVPENTSEAISWYRKAANQGDKNAIEEIEHIENDKKNKAAEKKKEIKENVLKICKTISIISIISYAVLFFVGYFSCPDVSELSFGIIFMTGLFSIPFFVIFFAKGQIKRAVFFSGCIILCIYFLANLGLLTCHRVEIPFAIAAIICNGMACILAMIQPKKSIYGY